MQTLLIVDDDESVRLALPEALSCAGRAIIVCGDPESAQLVVDATSRRASSPTFVLPAPTSQF
jgi:DNA-binding NtrC family response regulator